MITAVPDAKPITKPVDEIVTVVLFHTPPGVGSLTVVVDPPAHTVEDPIIGSGNALTVSTRVVMQPVNVLYVTVATPADIAVSKPVVGVIIATVVLLVLHVPPAVALLNVVADPAHIYDTPEIPEGGA